MNSRILQDSIIRTTTILWLMLLFESSSTALAATYYVSTSGNNSDPGNQSQPWRTIQHAADSVVAGDTAIVNAGTYSENVSTRRNGTAGNRIAFRALGASVLTGTFSINHSHITIDGFEVTAWAGQNAPGIDVGTNGDYCEILNNDIHDFSGRGIEIPRSTGTPAHPTNCLIKGNWFHGQHPATIYVILGGVNHVVENNEIGPGVVTEDAFRVWGDNHVIKNNYIHDIQSGGGHTDVFQSFEDNNWRIRNFVFENNTIRNWEGQAWMVDCIPASSGIIIRNNIYENVRSAGQSYCDRTLVYNNVFVNSGYRNCQAVLIRSYAGRGLGENSIVKNNIFYNTGCDNNDGWYSVDSGARSTFEGDYNLVYPMKSGFSEPHGKNGSDPLFVNAGAHDFHLQSGSPAINAGTALTGFNYDFDGTSRPQGSAWDIGAFEYGLGGPVRPVPIVAPTNLLILEGG